MTPVSIVLSAKDAGTTLARSMSSMLGQTLTDFDLILVDDRSNDDTFEIASSFARADSRVRVLRSKPPGGIVAALQTGTDAVSAPLLARMDADDVSHADRLRQQVDYLETHPELAVCACRVSVPNPLGAGIERYVDWTNSLVTPEQIARGRFIESPIVQPGVMMRTDAFLKVGGYQERGWAEDYDLWLNMLHAGMKMAKLPEVLLQWHDSPGRLTRANDRYSQKNFLKAKAHYLSRLPGADARGFSLCGAGPTGKRLARYLRAEGSTVHAFYEVHPRRIGENISGIPVVADTEIPPALEGENPLLISAVGTRTGREQVSSLATKLGFIEGLDFFAAS